MMEKQPKPSLLKRALLRQAFTSITDNPGPKTPKLSAAHLAAAVLGLAGPIMAGAATGHLQSGVAASLGGLVIGANPPDGAWSDRIPALAYALVSGSAAMFIGTAISGQPFAGWLIVAISAIVAFFGGITRTLARATTQFTIFLIIAGNMNPTGTHPAAMTFLFAAGVLWSSILLLCIPGNHQIAAQPQPKYTAKQYLRYWRHNLQYWKGWQYTLRITVCLAAAECIRQIWPHNHSYWIALTVAIVVHRDLPSALARTVQRTIGTFLGVLLVSIFLLGFPPPWVIIVVVAVLAGARTILININYAAYTAAITPLIMLLLDFGRPPSTTILVNRLMATLAGCLIALILGYGGWKRLIDVSPKAAIQK